MRSMIEATFSVGETISVGPYELTVLGIDEPRQEVHCRLRWGSIGPSIGQATTRLVTLQMGESVRERVPIPEYN